MNIRSVSYLGDKKASNFIDSLPDKLTLNDLSHTDFFASFRTTNQTIFKEVIVNHPTLTEFENEIVESNEEPFLTIEEMYETLKKAIQEEWDYSLFHIGAHSSGYDSRLISKILKELGLADDTLFIECMGEKDTFREIAEIQKLSYLIYNEQAPPDKLFASFLQFDGFWEKFNGVVSYPINVWFDVYKELVKQEVIPSQFQGITGYGSDETNKALRGQLWPLVGKDFELYFYWHKMLQLNLFNLYGNNWIHPFWNGNILKKFKVLKNITQLSGGQKLSRKLTSIYVPELNHIRGLKSEDLTEYRIVNEDIMKQIVQDYENSWYGKHIQAKPTNVINYYQWWGHYCAASLCEHLLDLGYKINK